MNEIAIVFAFVFSSNVVLKYLFVPTANSFERPVASIDFAPLAMLLAVVSGSVVTRLASIFVLEPLGVGFLALFFYLALTAPAGELLFRLAKRSKLGAGILGKGERVMYSISVAGPAFVVADSDLRFAQMLLAALAAPVGYFVAVYALDAINLRNEREKAPEALRGRPLALISAGLVALAFMGFDKLFMSFPVR